MPSSSARAGCDDFGLRILHWTRVYIRAGGGAVDRSDTIRRWRSRANARGERRYGAGVWGGDGGRAGLRGRRDGGRTALAARLQRHEAAGVCGHTPESAVVDRGAADAPVQFAAV